MHARIVQWGHALIFYWASSMNKLSCQKVVRPKPDQPDRQRRPWSAYIEPWYVCSYSVMTHDRFNSDSTLPAILHILIDKVATNMFNCSMPAVFNIAFCSRHLGDRFIRKRKL
jgi:hypothetical protein